LKTLALIELYQHDEVLRHYCDLLSDSVYKIKIFCSKVVYENLKEYSGEERFEWYVNSKGISIPDFLNENIDDIKKSNLVFVTTALSDFKSFYELSKKNKILLLVHNVHSFLAPKQHLSFQEPIFDRLRWLKLYFQGADFYKKKMLESLTGLAFPTETILNFVKREFDLPINLKLISLPFAYMKERERNEFEKLTITIPCTVSSELRDYDSIFKAFQKIENTLTEGIRLVLLGKPRRDGIQIIEYFKTLKSSKIEMIFFKKFISHQNYNQWLLKTDFMILPLKAVGRNNIYSEKMGYSKISGGINDMIRYSIPALIPSHYPLDDSLAKISERYSEKNLSVKIKKWISEETYTLLSSNKNLLFGKYGKAKVAAEFESQIRQFF
jgi:hypothetical protein